MRPGKASISVKRAKRFRRELSKPEIILWQYLRQSPGDHKFRRQHPPGPYILDFFCSKANLAIEIDGYAHDNADRQARDAVRDSWLAERRIDTLRIPARDVLNDVTEVGNAILAMVEDRLLQFGKAPMIPSASETHP